MNHLSPLNNTIFYGSNPFKNIKREKFNYSIKYNDIINFSYYTFINHNNIFYEINLDEINTGRNFILLKFFNIFFKNKSINNFNKNIIIYNFDLLNITEQYNILYLIDSNKHIKFLFYTKNINKIIEQIKSRCKQIRIKNNNHNKKEVIIKPLNKLNYSNITKYIYNIIDKYNIDFEEFVLILTKELLKNKKIDEDKLLDESLELCYNMNISNKKIFYLHKFIYKYKELL